jgi:hypothetical protein
LGRLYRVLIEVTPTTLTITYVKKGKAMIKNVIELLARGEHYGISEDIEIAKGKYEYITSWKRAWEKIKRLYHG